MVRKGSCHLQPRC